MAFAAGDGAAVSRTLDLKRARDLGVKAFEALRLDPTCESIAARWLESDVLAQGRVRRAFRADTKRLTALVRDAAIERDRGRGPVGNQLPAIERAVRFKSGVFERDGATAGAVA